jgi:hypothetical protein
MLVHQDAVNEQSVQNGHTLKVTTPWIVTTLSSGSLTMFAAIRLASSRALCVAISVTFMVRARKITVADDAVGLLDGQGRRESARHIVFCYYRNRS